MRNVASGVERISRSATCLLLVLFAAVLLAGCSPIEKMLAEQSKNSATEFPATPRLSCFLVLKDDQGPAMRLEIESIEVLANDIWLPLAFGPRTIDSVAIGEGQLFLGGQAVPPGSYQRLRLTVTKGKLREAEGNYSDIVPEPLRVEISLAPALELDPEDSRTLLLTWDVLKSLEGGHKLRPAFSATLPTRQLLNDLVFVSCPDIDTVYVVRADRNWVVDSFGLKGGPTYMALDPDPSRQRLYVLTSRDRMIKVVNISSNRVIDFLPAPPSDVPTFMTISPDGQSIFLLDERNGNISRMDPNTGRIVARAQLDFRPSYAASLPQQDLLAVSLSLSQKVLLLDPESLQVKSTISSGGSPQGIAVSEYQLYVAEYGDNTVSIFNLSRGGAENRLAVGLGPRRLLASGAQVYVSNYLEGSLSVLVPGQLGVSQEVRGLGRPLDMAFNESYRRLFVADEEAAALAVVDTNANLLLGHIPLGAKPFGLAVIQ